MKKKRVFTILVFFVLAATFVNAYYYRIEASCQDNICVQNKMANFSILVSNDGIAPVEFIGFELYETLNNTLITSLRKNFDPFSDKRGDTIVIYAGYKAKINLTGKLPKASYDDTLIYYPCFTTALNDPYTNARDNNYELKKCFNSNESLMVVECVNNNDCAKEAFCKSFKCKPLKCAECQYISNHTCRNYKCCNNDQCASNSMCLNNTCMKLDCTSSQYYFDHACQDLNCSGEEYIFERNCRKLNCNSNEAFINHTCMRLNCSTDEDVDNHTCSKIECSFNEFAENHTCNPLRCEYNETISSHACKPLDCYFFQYISSNSCITDRKLIKKLLIEAAVVVAIVLFLAIDFRKYFRSHNEKISRYRAAEKEENALFTDIEQEMNETKKMEVPGKK